MIDKKEHIIKLSATVNIFCAVDCDTFETARSISEDIQGQLKGRTEIDCGPIDADVRDFFAEIHDIKQQDIFCPGFWRKG